MEISKAQLRRLTDGRPWERGVGYHEQGNVLTLVENKDVIVAKVAGTHNYKVKLWLKDGEFDGQCSCLMGDSGVFCKHCVAVGLTYLDGGVKVYHLAEQKCTTHLLYSRDRPGCQYSILPFNLLSG